MSCYQPASTGSSAPGAIHSYATEMAVHTVLEVALL